jgi:cyclophilin family peptidyl-prolyl cis-trans isomerase
MITSLTALQRPHVFRLMVAGLVALTLAACGGGGDGPAPIPTVSSVAVVAGTSKYSQNMVIAVTGTDVDQGLFISSAACTGAFLINSAPYLSGYATAYYGCKVSAVGTNQVVVGRAVDQAVLGSVAFTVPLPQVTMTVSEGATFTGTMVFTLYPTNAPLTVNNFLNYVNTGFYLGTIFHRVNNTTNVVQGGGYLPVFQNVAPVLKPTTFAPIPLEVGRGLSNVLWSIGMARGAALDSATSQFYINVANNAAALDSLNGGYAVFGTVSAGTTVVDDIDTAPCTPFPGLSECAPNLNIQITAATQTQ